MFTCSDLVQVQIQSAGTRHGLMFFVTILLSAYRTSEFLPSRLIQFHFLQVFNGGM